MTTELRKTPEAYDVPLYDQEALDDAIGLERESYGQLMAENVRLRAALDARRDWQPPPKMPSWPRA